MFHFLSVDMFKKLKYFSKSDVIIWSSSVVCIVISFLLFDSGNYITLVASLIGVTSLIFCAKGNPFGNALMIVFSILYAIISYSCSYYGEMITYLGMTAPMSLFSLITWLKNPFKGNKAQVKVNSISRKEVVFMLFLSIVVTVAFYFILERFGTANIIPSTFSVTTSFVAAYLTLRRTPYFPLVYALNDLVLIVLWLLVSQNNTSYIPVIVCFVVFAVNDVYGFINWHRMKKKQTDVNEL